MLTTKGCHPRIRGSRRGAAYLVALVTLLVGFVLSMAMIRSAGAMIRAENARNKKRAAVNMAEAGIDYAFWQLHYGGKRLPYSADVTLATGSFHVDATDDGARDQSTAVITATGTCGGHSATVKRVGLGMLPYNYCWCENQSSLNSQTVISSGAAGGVRVNGSVTWTSTANNVTTGVWAATTITKSGTVTPLYPNSPSVRFPDIDFDYYDDIDDYEFWGDRAFSNLDVSPGCLVLVHGDIYVSGWYRGRIALVATGDIHVMSSLAPANTTSFLALITDDDIYVDSAATVVQAVMYAHDSTATGQVDLHGTKTVTGVAAGDDVDCDNTITIAQDTRLNLQVMKQLHLPGL